MKLRHYSATPVTKLFKVKPIKILHSAKPRGFWVSVDDDGEGWKDWCLQQRVFEDALTYAYDVTLKPDANILTITNPRQMAAFTAEYKSDHPINGYFTHAIDWPRLAKIYQGIIITPYLWSQRNNFQTFWYYGWDCASGCIWDIAAIEGLQMVANRDTIEA